MVMSGSAVGERTKSRKLRIKRVNLLRAYVTQHQWRIIWGEAAPGSNCSNGQADSSQTHNLFQLAAADPHAIKGGVASRRVKIDIVAIPRPIRKERRKVCQFHPLLGLEIKKHQASRVGL